MYWTVGSRDGDSSRIVKIEIGGTDTRKDVRAGVSDAWGRLKNLQFSVVSPKFQGSMRSLLQVQEPQRRTRNIPP